MLALLSKRPAIWINGVKPGKLAEGACRRFVAQLSWAMVTTCYCAAGTKTIAHAALASPTAPHLRTDRLLIVPFCDTSSVLCSMSSLVVCFAIDICTWQNVAVTNGDYSTSCMQQVLSAGRTQLRTGGIGSSRLARAWYGVQWCEQSSKDHAGTASIIRQTPLRNQESGTKAGPSAQSLHMFA